MHIKWVNVSVYRKKSKLYFKILNLKKMTGEIIKLMKWQIFILVSWYVVWFAVKKYEKKEKSKK